MLFVSIDNHSTFLNIFDKYLLLFREIKTPTNNDIYAICIKLHSDRKEIKEGIRLCEVLIQEIEKNENEDLKYESIIIYFWYSNLYFSDKNKTNATKFADIALELIKESNGQKLSMIDETGLKSISNQLNQIKFSSQITSPILNIKKFGRNDKIKVKYKNGNIKEDKYKRLEADILAERCILIE